MLAHYQSFEAILTLLAPGLVADLDDAIWGPQHRAQLRLSAHLFLDPTAQALDEIAANLVYAVATAPYLTRPSGKRGLCVDSLILKQKWYRRVRMANSST